MSTIFSKMPKIPVKLHCGDVTGVFEGWRHTIGHGGINRYPLPPRVRDGLAALKPRLVRTFIQEYFNICPERGVCDWSRLDPYMESLAASGGKLVASICIKPKPLYPVIDENVVLPNDAGEWKRLIEALVTRYSVERGLVTYWEVANESDIGEWGGCPYFTQDPAVYNEFYRLTAEAVTRACPEAKVGGPALADANSPMMEELLKYCAATSTRLDFVSWHLYSNDPWAHAGNVRRIRALAEKYYPSERPEMLVTEMGPGFEEVSVEEMAFDSRRSAAMGAALFEMMDAKLDWSFYYHIWDQVFVADQFRSFYSRIDPMHTHWDKTPHRFGLFGVCGEVRPAYFLYLMLGKMSGSELRTESCAADLRVKAALGPDGACRAMLVNYGAEGSRDVVAEIDVSGLSAGLRLMTVYRIDAGRKWEGEKPALLPMERRYVDILTPEDSERPFYAQIYCSADSVAMVCLEEAAEEGMVVANG
ncbi:MAG: hypothetical protein FWC55_03280 [Firmicutes bacterium]|nr:hypothetical protein [Bacillota bacterium]